MDIKISPEPVPNFTIARKELGVSWPIHYNAFGIVFALLMLYTCNSLYALIQSTVKFQRRRIFIIINICLIYFSLVTSLSLLIDPYDSGEYIEKINFRGILFVFIGLRVPSLTSSFSLIQLSFLEAAKLQLYSPRLQNYRFIICVMTAHFALFLSGYIYLLYMGNGDIFLMVCHSFTFCLGVLISITSIYSGSKVILYYKRNLNALQNHKKQNKQKIEAHKEIDTDELHTIITSVYQDNGETTDTISVCELDQPNINKNETSDINKNDMSILLNSKPHDSNIDFATIYRSNVDFATNYRSNSKNGDSNTENGKIIFPRIENENCINLPPDYFNKNLLRLSNEMPSMSENTEQKINVISTIKRNENDNIISVNLNYNPNKKQSNEGENPIIPTNQIHTKTVDFICEEIPATKINLKVIPKSKHISFQDKCIRKLAIFTIILSLFGLGYCVVVICPLLITLSIRLSSDPWIWYAEQSIIRCLECGMVLTMSYLARRNLLSCTKRH